eukprot:38494_1
MSAHTKCILCKVTERDNLSSCIYTHTWICNKCAKGMELIIEKCPMCEATLVCGSVNIKSVETWDTNDFRQWIKLGYYFDAKSKAAMDRIISRQKYSGKELKHCNTQDSFMKLFKHQIETKTARILREYLTIEREMYIKRKQSARIIKQG